MSEQTTAEYRFTCMLHSGLHARPASMIAELLTQFQSEITIGKGDAKPPVNARSVLSIVGLDVQKGDACIVVARGADARQAIAALTQYVEKTLIEGDDLPSASATTIAAELPMTLKRLSVPHHTGRPVCGGIGFGSAVSVQGLHLSKQMQDAKPAEVDVEISIARQGIAAVKRKLELKSKDATSRLEKDLLLAHAQIACDPSLWTELEIQIRSGKTSAQAVVAASERFIATLRSAASAYIRDRVVDVQDVCMQVLSELTGGTLESMSTVLDRDSIVFAEVLTANQLLSMDRTKLAGLVLGPVGATSHTVILARSLRIPTVIDVANAGTLAAKNQAVIVDGDAGVVFSEVTPPVTRHYQRHQKTQERWVQKRIPAAMKPALTSDGVQLEVGANASLAGEVVAAVERGADGVGLLRTELLFLDRAAEPGEEEQFEAYLAVIKAAAGRPVIIRTFDIGGDKPASYLAMAEEENPFLGVRGLRLYEKYPDLLRKQLRAILRAAANGPVKIMAPMVAIPEEAAWFKSQVKAAAAQLETESIAIGRDVPIGVMIEIPATALVMDQLCDEVDFFSIGTNDLCQYWMAVDRGNAGVANLYNPRQPSFIRLLKLIVDGARANKKWIGICGEMAGTLQHLPLMVGLGFNEISIAPGEVLKLKTAVEGLNAADCRALVDAACACKDAAAVEELLKQGAGRVARSEKILAGEMILIDSDANSKEEAIKEAVDLLYVSGRTVDARVVEAAVWAREATYSTGLGYGFAVPHCKTDAVAVPTFAVVRLQTPVDWGSMDGLPVKTVLLLAVPASESAGGGAKAHMKVFASLARKLMHEEFRERLSGAPSCEAIEACLREELGLD